MDHCYHVRKSVVIWYALRHDSPHHIFDALILFVARCFNCLYPCDKWYVRMPASIVGSVNQSTTLLRARDACLSYYHDTILGISTHKVVAESRRRLSLISSDLLLCRSSILSSNPDRHVWFSPLYWCLLTSRYLWLFYSFSGYTRIVPRLSRMLATFA